MNEGDGTEKHTAHYAIEVAPGYFACKRRIERLRKFQDLIRHRTRWAHEIDAARPIEELIGTVSEVERPKAIERAISRLVVAVGHDLDAVGVSSGISILVDSDDIDEVISGRQVRRDFDLIDDFFNIPRRHGVGNAAIFDDTLRVLEEAIGAYELIKQRAKFDFINPLAWCAWLLRVPVLVLQRSGIATGEVAGDKALRFVAWIVGMLMIAFLILLSVRVGVSIPWNVVLKIIPGL